MSSAFLGVRWEASRCNLEAKAEWSFCWGIRAMGRDGVSEGGRWSSEVDGRIVVAERER